MTEKEIIRATLHRTWFTWPSYMYYAWWVDEEHRRWFEENAKLPL